LRVHCDNVPGERLADVLTAGWKLASGTTAKSTLHFDELRAAQSALAAVEIGEVRQPFAELVHRIRHAGIPVSTGAPSNCNGWWPRARCCPAALRRA
jgi:MoxR-like ATPase